MTRKISDLKFFSFIEISPFWYLTPPTRARKSVAFLRPAHEVCDVLGLVMHFL